MNTSSTRPPNIVLLVGEDTGRHMGCYGDPYARTPTLDRLAADGALFERAFSHAPVCAPSRGSMVSGCYPYALGIHQMRSQLCQPPRMFTHELVDAGYEVLWPTKLDFNFTPLDGWCTSTEPWWENGLPRDRPFFAYRNMAGTHESTMWRPPAELDPNWQEPTHQSWADPQHVPLPPYLPDLPEVRLQLARYYDNLAEQDRQWQRCLQAVEQSGQADNTVVIYLTDHGRGMPREKRWCYEAGIHLPLIIRWPQVIQPATVREDLVSWVDIAPTLLRIAGIDVPPHYHGLDFLAAEAAQQPREFHFAGRDRMGEAYDCQRVCRSRDWLYVRNYFPEIPTCRRNAYQEQAPAVRAMREAHANGTLQPPADIWFRTQRAAHELFYIPDDPHCLNNLADDPDHAAQLQRHQQALTQHLEAVGDYGSQPESELVAARVIENSIDAYSARLAPLPDHLAPEPTQTSILMPRTRD
jgi:arylsulfatase A-like enzyme